MNEDDGRALIAEYAQAMQPYIECGGSIPREAFNTRSWRYFVEINSGCNLRCSLCACGNRKGYEHINGFMSLELLNKVLDKIQSENPAAIVLPYGNSEPFLHPNLPECIAAIKSHRLNCEIATNFNHLNRLDEVLAAGADRLLISVSGFTQEVYGKSHIGGDIEKVKTNMLTLKSALEKCHKPPHTMVHYHMYRDNLGEQFDQMKAFTEALGFQLIISWARSISMENTIQYMRMREKERTGTVAPLEFPLPPVSSEFEQNIKRLSISPEKAVEMYARFPVCNVCPVGDIFTFVRHDGLSSLCACVSDRRFTVGNYLDLTQEQLSAKRRGHPICRECLRYRLNLYFHVVDGSQFNL